jgi:cytochrome c
MGRWQTLMIALAVFFIAGVFERPAAQEMEVVTGGEIEYQNNCAVCHGVNGRGDGIMRRFLTIPPSNLTQLAKKMVANSRSGRSTARSMVVRTFAATAAAKCRFGAIALEFKPAGTTVVPALKPQGDYWGWSFTCSIFRNNCFSDTRTSPGEVRHCGFLV